MKKNSRIVYSFALMAFFLLISCSNRGLENQIEGQWAIEDIIYNGKSYKNQMYSNVVIFRTNNEISIPETFHFKIDENATWKVVEKTNTVRISTSSIVFDDIFEVEFINRTETDPLGIILKSDMIYIKAYKLLDFQR